MNTPHDIQTEIKKLLQGRGMTQMEVAALLGVGQPTVSKIIHGQQKKLGHTAYAKLLSFLNSENQEHQRKSAHV